MNYLLDTHAWIEYADGSNKGKTVQTLLESEGHSFATVEPSLAEIRYWCAKKSRDFDAFLAVIRTNSSILPVSTEEWIESGEEKFEQRKKIKDIGLIDCVLLVKQKRMGAKIITGDPHFRHAKNVLYLK
ncbi:MAG: PIN domain-containing protein [Candidatus Diapherotrites archaeon]